MWGIDLRNSVEKWRGKEKRLSQNTGFSQAYLSTEKAIFAWDIWYPVPDKVEFSLSNLKPLEIDGILLISLEIRIFLSNFIGDYSFSTKSTGFQRNKGNRLKIEPSWRRSVFCHDLRHAARACSSRAPRVPRVFPMTFRPDPHPVPQRLFIPATSNRTNTLSSRILGYLLFLKKTF